MSLFKGVRDRRVFLDVLLLSYVIFSAFFATNVPPAIEIAILLLLIDEIRKELRRDRPK